MDAKILILKLNYYKVFTFMVVLMSSASAPSASPYISVQVSCVVEVPPDQIHQVYALHANFFHEELFNFPSILLGKV